MDLSNPKITPALTMTRSDLATQVATCPTAYPAGATRELAHATDRQVQHAITQAREAADPQFLTQWHHIAAHLLTATTPAQTLPLTGDPLIDALTQAAQASIIHPQPSPRPLDRLIPDDPATGPRGLCPEHITQAITTITGRPLPPHPRICQARAALHRWALVNR